MLNLASSSPRGSVEQRKAIANKCEKSHWKSSKYVKTDLNSQKRLVRNTLEIGSLIMFLGKFVNRDFREIVQNHVVEMSRLLNFCFSILNCNWGNSKYLGNHDS